MLLSLHYRKGSYSVHIACLRTALHRAFYWGNYQCAAVLLAANAHLSLTDFKVTNYRLTEVLASPTRQCGQINMSNLL